MLQNYVSLKFRGYNVAEDHCNCGYFLAHAYCKHSLAAKVDLKVIDLPNNQAIEALVKGNPIGRPANISEALNRE